MRRAIEREFEALEVEVAEAQHAAAAQSGESAAILAARRRATHRNALAKLRPPPPHAPSAATLLAAGAACGATACVLANVLALLQQAHAQPAAADHVAALLPVLRGPLLMLAHFALCVPPACVCCSVQRSLLARAIAADMALRWLRGRACASATPSSLAPRPAPRCFLQR